jgi:hypothetical protein
VYLTVHATSASRSDKGGGVLVFGNKCAGGFQNPFLGAVLPLDLIGDGTAAETLSFVLSSFSFTIS